MTVNCESDSNCTNHNCLNLISLYSGFYGRLFRANNLKTQARFNQQLTMHGINLGIYKSFEQYRQDLGKRSSFFLRHARKAIRNGYFVEQFNAANHSIDMVSIHQSMKIRSFGVVFDAWLINIEKFGGIPIQFKPLQPLDCHIHWEKYVGVFQDKPGYRQGAVVTNKQLVGYARLHRIGNMLAYKDFLGDGRFLIDGVMKLLHLEIMKWVMNSNEKEVVGIDNIAHGSIERGNKGLFFWKKKALFAPYRVNMIEVDLPSDFNSTTYLNLNPDVKNSKLGAALHYKVHGRRENRIYK